jgi:hypothetical protein
VAIKSLTSEPPGFPGDAQLLILNVDDVDFRFAAPSRASQTSEHGVASPTLRCCRQRGPSPPAICCASGHSLRTVSCPAHMLPQTDDILRFNVNLGLDIVDRGLGAGFGTNVRPTGSEIDQKAEESTGLTKPVIG